MNVKHFYYGYILVIAGIIASIFMVGTYTSFGIFFKPISLELEWTRATTSGATSLASLVMGVFSIVAGRLTDKYGPRLVLIASGILMGLGNLLMSQTRVLWHIYVYYGVLIGAGMSASEIPIMTTIARWFVKRRGTMTGITKVGAGIGIMVVPLLSGWLISISGWRNAYLILGVVALLSIISMALLYKRDPSEIGKLPDGDTKVVDNNIEQGIKFLLGDVLRTRQFWMFTVSWFCFMFCLQIVMVHIVNHVTDVGISSTIAASVVSVIGGLSIAGRLGLASLSDVTGRKTAYLIAFSFLASAFLSLQFAREIWSFYLFGALYGIAHGACFTLLPLMMARLFGISSLGSVLGMILFFGTLGSLISPVFAGWVFDVTNSYLPAFWVGLGFSILGLVLLVLLKPVKGIIISGDRL